MDDIRRRRRRIEQAMREAMDRACAEFDVQLAALRAECGATTGHAWHPSSSEYGPAGYEVCGRCGAGRSGAGR